jgi:hypothetical protein
MKELIVIESCYLKFSPQFNKWLYTKVDNQWIYVANFNKHPTWLYVIYLV